MKIISLATLTAISIGGLIWSNPAQAVLLRFTGWSSNGEGAAVEFDVNQDIDLLTLSDGTYENLVSDLLLINLAFNSIEGFISSDEPDPTELQRSYFSGTDIAFDLIVSSESPYFGIAGETVDGGLMNKVFTVIFDVSLEEPAILNQPSSITGTLQFGIGNESNLFEFEDESNNDGFSDGALQFGIGNESNLFEFEDESNNDGFSDGALDLEFDISFVEGGLFDYVPSGTDFSTDLLAEENPADIPEGGSSLVFLLFILSGATLLRKQAQFRKVA